MDCVRPARIVRRVLPPLAGLAAALCLATTLCLAGPPAAAATIPTTAPLQGWPAADPAPNARWTVMVYMSGDNDLEKWMVHDIDREMAVAGSNADVQVVALADRGSQPSAADGGWSGARLFHVTQGMAATADNAVADL